MKVKELITELEKYNTDSKVIVASKYDYDEIEYVEHNYFGLTEEDAAEVVIISLRI